MSPFSNVCSMTLVARSTRWGGLFIRHGLLASLVPRCLVDGVWSPMSPPLPDLPSIEAALECPYSLVVNSTVLGPACPDLCSSSSTGEANLPLWVSVLSTYKMRLTEVSSPLDSYEEQCVNIHRMFTKTSVSERTLNRLGDAAVVLLTIIIIISPLSPSLSSVFQISNHNPKQSNHNYQQVHECHVLII